MDEKTAADKAAQAALESGQQTAESVNSFAAAAAEAGIKPGEPIILFAPASRKALQATAGTVIPGFIGSHVSDVSVIENPSLFNRETVLRGGYVKVKIRKGVFGFVQVLSAEENGCMIWPHPTKKGASKNVEYKAILDYYPTQRMALEAAQALGQEASRTFVTETETSGSYSPMPEPTAEQCASAGVYHPDNDEENIDNQDTPEGE